MTNLQILSLHTNLIEGDLNALARLTNLTELRINHNQISGIAHVANLTSLEVLALHNNLIRDISSISQMINLQYLDLRADPLNRTAHCIFLSLIQANNPGVNLLVDPNPYPKLNVPVSFPDQILLAAVETALGITNPILCELLLLKTLSVPDSGITDLTGLKNAENLQSLDLSGNVLTDLSALAALEHLTLLDLSNNQVSDITPLGVLTKLQFLDLRGNPLDDFANCATIPKIKENNPGILLLLDFTTPSCTVVFEDANLKAAVEASLNVINPTTFDMAEMLFFEANEINIKYLTGLETATNLQTLVLRNNQISDISPLAGLANLKTLSLQENPLNTEAYCKYLPMIQDQNPGINLQFNANPNPLTQDCSINLSELTVFAKHWMEDGCEISNNFCGGADLIHSGFVGMENFAHLTHYWMEPLE